MLELRTEFFDGPFLRLPTPPRSIMTSWVYFTPSIANQSEACQIACQQPLVFDLSCVNHFAGTSLQAGLAMSNAPQARPTMTN
jgi:hypothetical protein